MFIDNYFSRHGDRISFTREQASAFAKGVADDFNPLHDENAKRFCVPGDLLFSVILRHYGLSCHMDFTFSGMVVDGIDLVMPEAGDSLEIDDVDGRHYLSVRRSGENSRDAALIHGSRVVGVIPHPLERRELAHRGLHELIVVDDMHQRKAAMAARAHAFVALPGGYGTL